jgi:solute carrier family 35 protein F1/2
LFVIYSIVYSFQQKTPLPWRQNRTYPWWNFVILAFADVEATFLVVTAYRYTTIVSIILISSFVTPCVMVLSMLFLKRKYRFTHYLGVVICLSGIAFLVICQYFLNQEAATHTPLQLLIGNVLVICSSILYAISNVGAEYVMKGTENSFQNSLEYLSTFSFFALILNTIQMLIFETKSMISVRWNFTIVIYLVGFSLALFLFSSSIPHFMNLSSASFFNLSMMTQNLYSILASYIIFSEPVTWYSFVSFAMILIGILLYNVLDEIYANDSANNGIETDVVGQIEGSPMAGIVTDQQSVPLEVSRDLQEPDIFPEEFASDEVKNPL